MQTKRAVIGALLASAMTIAGVSAAWAQEDDFESGRQQFKSGGPAPEGTDASSGYYQQQRDEQRQREMEQQQQSQQQQLNRTLQAQQAQRPASRPVLQDDPGLGGSAIRNPTPRTANCTLFKFNGAQVCD